MTDPLSSMKRRRAKLLEEVAAIDRDIDDYLRLASKYGPGIGISDPTAEPSFAAGAHIHVDTASLRPEDLASGTIGTLIRQYETHEKSPFQKLRFATRNNYVSKNSRESATENRQCVCVRKTE